MSNIFSNIPNIFIVDDDATMRLLMVDALEEDGYTIAEYSNGKDAMDAIENKQPDMVLLDVKMPIMNGFDVCSLVREKYGDINTSIVMVTGLDDSDSIEKSFQLGATAFISKPINWITFPHVIRYLLKARSAFVDLKSREVHLEHMDEISRIITQDKPRNTVLQESIHALLGIFHADSAIIISTTGINRPNIDILFEASKETLTDHSICARNLECMLAEDILNRARNSEYPIIFTSTKQQDSSAALFSPLYSCMIKHLHTDDDRSWYLTVLKCDDQNVWSSLEQETFYRSGIRLGGVLSQHLLMERLHRSEHLLRQAQHIGHLGNWSLNVANRQLTWSEEMFLIYGYNPERFTPTYEHFYKINFEEDNARITKFEQTDFASGETFNIEHRILLPTGETRWVHEQAVGLLDESGQLIEVNGTVQDITERLKKQEQELHDNKMEAIGKLTSGIAHDFGNLMTIAKGNLDLLQEILPEQYNICAGDMEILDDANSAIQDGVELTKQLLTFSRKKSTAPEKICIEHTLDKFNKLIKNTLGAKITLSIHVQNDLPDILVDSALFVSSLINIIINARDAMPGGGEVTISATQDQSLSENRVSISIDDTGTGMTDHVYQHALEPFFTTKDEGTGLGLSMAYGFMKQSGGNLSIDTRPGHGTRVLMNFPAYTGAGLAQSEGAPFNMRTPRNKTILVVEDNPAVRQLVVRCLSRLGFTILESDNATNAMDMLSENSSIELLFTDILMPGEMNGRELAEWALGQFPGLKIVLTTAAKKEALDLLHARDGTFQFLLKPYSKHDLIQKILMFLKDD